MLGGGEAGQLALSTSLPRGQRCSGLSTQTMPEGMDRRHNLPNARMGRWATHQVAGTRPPASPQVAHRFEAFQKALPRLGPLQSSAIAQSVAHGHVAAFDSFGRLATYSVQPRPDVLSAGQVVATAFTYGWW